MSSSHIIKNEERSFNQIVVFDWDDTLYCSTYLHNLGYDLESKRPFPEPLHSQLLRIDDVSCQILKEATTIAGEADVYIITNAEEKWVELSAQLFLPKTGSYIQKIGFKVISARSLYEPAHPSQPAQWKLLTFQTLMDTRPSTYQFCPLSLQVKSKCSLNSPDNYKRNGSKIQSQVHIQKKNSLSVELSNGARKCVCSFGDSQAERMAAHHVVQTIPGAFYKTIKFLDRPNPEELYFQLAIILRNLKMVLDYPEQMDEMIVIAQKFET